jgi:hypothetical protein
MPHRITSILLSGLRAPRQLVWLAYVGLEFLRTIDPAEANALSVAVVQYVDGVAVEDGYDGARKVGGQCARQSYGHEP